MNLGALVARPAARLPVRQGTGAERNPGEGNERRTAEIRPPRRRPFWTMTARSLSGMSTTSTAIRTL